MHLWNVLGFCCCCNKWPQPEWLTQHPFIISQFLWLSSTGKTWNSLFSAQSQNQGAGGAVLLPGGSRVVYKNPGPFPSWLSVWVKLSGSHLHSQALQFSSIFSASKCGPVLFVLESLTSFLQYYLFLFLFSPASNSSPALRGWRDYTGSGLIFLFKVSGSVFLHPSAESFPSGLRYVFDQIITKRESWWVTLGVLPSICRNYTYDFVFVFYSAIENSLLQWGNDRMK